jgi:hypothetical protein
MVHACLMAEKPDIPPRVSLQSLSRLSQHVLCTITVSAPSSGAAASASNHSLHLLSRLLYTSLTKIRNICTHAAACAVLVLCFSPTLVSLRDAFGASYGVDTIEEETAISVETDGVKGSRDDPKAARDVARRQHRKRQRGATSPNAGAGAGSDATDGPEEVAAVTRGAKIQGGKKSKGADRGAGAEDTGVDRPHPERADSRDDPVNQHKPYSLHPKPYTLNPAL